MRHIIIWNGFVKQITKVMGLGQQQPAEIFIDPQRAWLCCGPYCYQLTPINPKTGEPLERVKSGVRKDESKDSGSENNTL